MPARLTEELKKAAARTPLAPSKRFRRSLRPGYPLPLVRIGTDYGGWTVPDGAIDASWVCYCGGVGYDVSFDLGLVERYGCVVHAFDPTPSAIRYAHEAAGHEERLRFFPWGLWS